MDFQELLSQADYNRSEAKYTAYTPKYSAELPPPKKVPKSSVQSENIKRFLEKKKAEENAKVTEARKQKEKLLAIRAQNSKNNKKAKIMASRTKDNDFSKIKLTDDEIASKKKVEAELLRKNLADKVERMKARIEMEEKEKLLPKKRKRKSKNMEPAENLDDRHNEMQNEHKELNSSIKGNNNNPSQKDKNKPRPPPPTLSFTELLKIAQKKQFEPTQIVVQKKEEERPMTKKERKLKQEEIEREKRKQERLLRGESGLPSKSNSSPASSLNKKNISDKVDNKKPVVIHVGKDISKSETDSSRFKVPKSTNLPANKNVPIKHTTKDIKSDVDSKFSNSNPQGKPVKSSLVNGQLKMKSREGREIEMKQKVVMPKKSGLKINPVQASSNKTPKLDEEALKASLEKEIRAKIEREIEEKIAAKFAQFQNLHLKSAEKPPEVPKQVKKEPETGNNIPKKVLDKPAVHSRKDIEKMIAMKKQAQLQKQMKPKLPQKKPFHMNPYLDPPRRLLEPQRPPRPPIKKRLESDDEDDDDDDDMDDFIVDSSQNEENYSKYIQEIFGYDRNKYVDDDDDDIVESSFAQQMNEEKISAKLGYLEDLEEERLEAARNKKKKKK